PPTSFISEPPPLIDLFPTTAPPPPPPETTTTLAPDTTTVPTTAPGGDGDTTDGLSPLGGGPGQIVPREAAALLSSIARSAPNNNSVLVANEQALLAVGFDADQAARLAYGHFPVAGPAHWGDDWLEPRFAGTEFRYHLGIDVVAPYGTPLRSPDDGTIRLEESEAGGVTVKVVLPSGSYYELLHMSAYAPGLQAGAAVHTGDLVGFVGSSGASTGAHLHLGYWVGGATAQSPKPLLDQWVVDANNAVNALNGPSATSPSLLGTALTRALTDGPEGREPETTGATGTDLLLVASANPSGGALQVAKSMASQVAADVDWRRQAQQEDAAVQAWAASSARAWTITSPLVPPALAAVLAPASTPPPVPKTVSP
ncbi:MAG: M23 family metallopeptidase, partial [Acidimicrobiales bacterium]